jgi:hypothetical protein
MSGMSSARSRHAGWRSAAMQMRIRGWSDEYGDPGETPEGIWHDPWGIAEYVRKRHVLTLEDAIRTLMAWPAARMRMYDRGVIRGACAQMLRLQDTATYASPTKPATGIDWVLVNGQAVADHESAGRGTSCSNLHLCDAYLPQARLIQRNAAPGIWRLPISVGRTHTCSCSCDRCRVLFESPI